MEVGKTLGNAVILPLKETPAPKNVEWAEDTPIPEMVSLEEVNCTLHISDEGYRRWEQSMQDEGFPAAKEVPSAEDAVSVDAVDESAEEEELSSIERLSRFADRLFDIIKNTKREATKDTDDEKVAALEQMRQLKEDQEEEYQRQVKEAQAMAVKQAKTKNIVEKGMRDLTIMLESFKPPKDDKKEDKQKAADTDTDAQRERLTPKTEEELPGNREEMLGISDGIRRHAFHAELAMDGPIRSIYDHAQRDFQFVRDAERTLREQMSGIYAMMQEEEVSDAEVDEAVDNYLEDETKTLKYLKRTLGAGLERMYNLKLITRAGYGNQNMIFAQRAQDTIEEAADLSVLDGLYQEGYESATGETIEELAKHIRDLLEEERMSRKEDTEKIEGADAVEGSESAEKVEATNDSEDAKELETTDDSDDTDIT